MPYLTVIVNKINSFAFSIVSKKHFNYLYVAMPDCFVSIVSKLISFDSIYRKLINIEYLSKRLMLCS